MKGLSSLVEILADGALHSGEEIAKDLAVSRAAVWKKIQQIQNIGLPVSSVRGLGYQLTSPLELLSSKQILSYIDVEEKPRLEIHSSVKSTNTSLIEKSFSDNIHKLALLAEHQEAGKGRRGRQWLGTPFSNIYLSVGWHYDMGVSALEGLSLAVGVELVERLRRLLPEEDASKFELKWPNDVLFNGRKLAGILIEVVGDIAGGCVVVVGLGLNVKLSEANNIDQPWIDASTILGDISRNMLAALTINSVIAALLHFENSDFSVYQKRWQELGAYHGEKVLVIAGERTVEGLLKGVSKAGALVLQTNNGEAIFHGGEVSLRLGLGKNDT